MLELDSVSDISEFRGVDPSILTGIEEVRFDQCSTRQLEPLCAVSTLGTLTFTNSNIKNTDQFQGLEKLKINKLDLSFNSVLSVASLSLSVSLRALSLRANGLKTPAQVAGLFGLASLEELDLSDNCLTALTPGFVQLRSLKKLNLANN